MIDKALKVLADSIQHYLKSLPELNVTSEKRIFLTNIVKSDGSFEIPDNSLGLSLVNIEEERVVKTQNFSVTAPNGRVMHRNPEIKLNLFIIIAAHFNDYMTGLENLSGVIRFFQSKNVFTPADSPQLDIRIEKLIVDLFSLNFEQQHHLWGLLGAKYLPSVIYRIRLIAIQEKHAVDEQPAITTISTIERNVK